MGHNSRHFILQKPNQLWVQNISIGILKFWLHIVRNLADGVTGSISEHGVLVMEIASNHLDNGTDMGNILNVLANL